MSFITCLPSPAASAAVLEAGDGLLAGLGRGKVWAEMSTTDEAEVRRLGALVAATGAGAADCPVSGGCHRAATGNIAIFAGCDRPTFERILPLLATMGRRILHTGPLGSATVLKVVTNYLASANLLAICEALVTAKAAGMDLNTTYEAIRISSGNSFVHETEGQVILNGSRNINFTMDLVVKDMALFQSVADRAWRAARSLAADPRHLRRGAGTLRPPRVVPERHPPPRGTHRPRDLGPRLPGRTTRRRTRTTRLRGRRGSTVTRLRGHWCHCLGGSPPGHGR